MTTITSGRTTVEIDTIVSEAVTVLGYFRPEASAALSDRVAQVWGGTPYNFERDGECVAPFPGKPYARIASAIWDALTEKGKADPSHACKATYLRISFNIRRALQLAEEKCWRSLSPRVQLRGMTEYTCSVGREQAGTVVELNRRALGLFVRAVPLPKLPFPGCDAEWCACRWDMMPKD